LAGNDEGLGVTEMKRTLTTVLGLAAATTLLCGSRPALASLGMQKQAKEAGVPVENCLYCHGEKMPKKGAFTLNERGKWLEGEKDKRKAKEVDGAWLKDYVEKKGESKK
jgi:hypothetical protein